MCSVVPELGDLKPFIGAGADEHCEPEWCSFVSLDPPELLTHEELIFANHLAPDSVQIK